MATKKGRLEDHLEPAKIGKMIDFLIDHTSSHGIAKEAMLVDLAERVGLTLETTVSQRKARGKRGAKAVVERRAVLSTPDGFRVFSVTLLPAWRFRELVEKEGLGGSVADGDWWGFTARYLVEDAALMLTGFTSSKMGRGGIWQDCVGSLYEYRQKMPAADD